jgi:hypothetical protein
LATVLGAAFFFGVVAAPPDSALSRAAASKTAFLSALGSATSMGGGAGRPLKACQSPVTLRMAATGSVGWAPTPSQYAARSPSTSMKEGFSLGWYLPIVSMTRPSRLVRASATTMR